MAITSEEPRRSLLVVDDNDTFLGALKALLVKTNYDVQTCNEPQSAEHLFKLQNFDAAILDIQLPGKSGNELLKIFKSFKKNTPVILMTGFSDLIETWEADQLGADGFLAKPFKKEDLIAILDRCLGKRAPVESVDLDSDFCRLSIEDFVSGKDMRSDIYVRLSNTKYIKIAHQGENIPIERIRSYKERSIQHLYLRKDDFRKYVGFSLSLAPRVVASTAIDKSRKLRFLKHTGETIVQHLFLDQLEEESFSNAKDLVENTVSILADDSDLFSLLSLLNTHTDFLYAHSLGVALYSVMIARQMKWESATTIFKLASGSILHDIGMKEIQRSVLEKSRISLTPEEITLVESHTTRGVDILSGFTGIAGDILQIVGQHHENYMGTGHPSRLYKFHIHPLARVVQVADEFCMLAIKNPDSAGMAPTEALKRMLNMGPRYDPIPFGELLKLFKIDAAPDSGKQA